MSKLKLGQWQEKEKAFCVHLLCQAAQKTHTLVHTQCERVLSRNHAEILSLDGMRGCPSNRKWVSFLVWIATLGSLSSPSEINSRWVFLIVHRTLLWVICWECGSIEWRSSPSQLETTVYHLRCRSYWLLSWRRTHSLFPVPIQHRRHWLAEAGPVLPGAGGEMSTFVWGARWRLRVRVCAHGTVNMADFLICVI